MVAEQMAMMEALQFIARLLIYFALPVVFLILIVNMARIVRIRFYHSKSKVENFRKTPPGEFQKGPTKSSHARSIQYRA